MPRFLTLVTVGFTVAVATPAVGQAPDTATVRAALTQLASKFTTASLAGDAVAIAALFTDDARAEFAGFPSAAGRAAIQSTYETLFKATKLKVWEAVIQGVNSPSADVASAGGTVHEFGDMNGKPYHGWWRWAAAYRKGPDGQYRVSFLMAFPDSTKSK